MANRYGISTTIPAWNLKDEGYFKDKVREIFEKEAQRYMPYEFVIRELEEGDLSLANWNLPTTQDLGWSGTPWVNHPLTNHDAVVIYGVSSPSDILSVRKLIFKKGFGAVIIGRNDLSELKTLEPALKAIKECRDQEWLMETFGGSVFNVRMVGYFQESYIWRPQDHIGVGVVYVSGMEPKELKLMGYIAETVGKTIAPDVWR